MDDLKQKNVVITGASRGIGKAIAIHSAKLGYNVAISCKNSKEQLDKVKNEITSYGVECITFVGDMGNSSDVCLFWDKINKTFEHIDVLVNNAGQSFFGLTQDISDKNWHELFKANVDSVFFSCREFLKNAIKNKNGRIINISSVWGLVGASYEVAYSTTKGAIVAFTKSLAKEVAPSGITVNAIAPGVINTDMNAHLDASSMKELIESIPICRLGTVDEIASICTFLFTTPKYLTGQIITVDGGMI